MNGAMKSRGYEQHRACAWGGLDLRVDRRTSKRPAVMELRAMMKELASKRRQLGSCRLHVLLKRKGWAVNWKKLHRLYHKEGLPVCKRTGCKRAVGTKTPMTIPQAPNQKGSRDFKFDAQGDGPRL